MECSFSVALLIFCKQTPVVVLSCAQLNQDTGEHFIWEYFSLEIFYIKQMESKYFLCYNHIFLWCKYCNVNSVKSSFHMLLFIWEIILLFSSFFGILHFRSALIEGLTASIIFQALLLMRNLSINLTSPDFEAHVSIFHYLSTTTAIILLHACIECTILVGQFFHT